MATSTASVPTRGDRPVVGSSGNVLRTRRRRRREGVAGYVFLSPWLLGFIGITAMPMLYSLYLSFTNSDLLSTSEWIGLDNYRTMFTKDPQFWHAVQVTVTYAVIATPLKLGTALAVAMLLNRGFRGISVFRGLFYLPSLLGGSVGLAIIWQAMFSRDGSFNSLLRLVGIEGKPWVNDPDWVLSTVVVLAMWQFGAPMVIFLAGLKQIPGELYEAASVDGANKVRKFLSITLPMLSPVIFFNLVLETIHSFQGFTTFYVVSGGTGGPSDATLIYTLLLYQKGWTEFLMGYASALAWVFLLAVGLLTAVLFATGRFWVHYGDEGN